MVLGPPVFLLAYLSRSLWHRTLLGQAHLAHKEMTRKAKALRPGWKPRSQSAVTPGVDASGTLRLGFDKSRRPFDLSVPEITQHILIPGASNSGKTTTLVRLVHGAIDLGYAIAIVDLKGGSLGLAAQKVAASRHLPFTKVDPTDSASVGYNPCTGDPAHIANKLIGAFSYGPAAEIYKNTAMEIVPLLARAIQATGSPVSLDEIYDALGKGGLLRLARGVEGRLRDRLIELDESAGKIGEAGYSGLQRRIGALMEGRFGPIFERRPALDWHSACSKPQVSYIALSVTAADQDVELFARVILQDLKQLCDYRLHNPGIGVPLLVIFDEFAALNEAQQIVDLLLQAREARMSVVVATQLLPQEERLRLPLLQSGVIIAHRVGTDDAKQLADEMGTHMVPFATSQIDFDSGMSEKGSVRMVDEFNIHPNVFRTLPIGTAVVYAKRSERREIVQVHKDE
jgi:hypothetical protein